MADDFELMLNEARRFSSADTLRIDLWYPRIWAVKFIEVGLMDVRAADSIRVSYDFDRDGWKIEQASTFRWDTDDPVRDPGWQEVAFIQAWAREDRSHWSYRDEEEGV